MSDLISKSELIEALKQRMKLHEKDAETLATKEAFYDDEELFLRLADECQAIIELVEEQKAKDKWIPCSERLPNKEEAWYYNEEENIYEPNDFIVQVKGAELPTVAMFDGEEFSHGYAGEGFGFMNEIVAWQPLPEAYKGE
jgi:ClpP class serine protease